MRELLQQWRDAHALNRTGREFVPDGNPEKALSEARLIIGEGELYGGQPRFSWRYHTGIPGAARLYDRANRMKTE